MIRDIRMANGEEGSKRDTGFRLSKRPQDGRNTRKKRRNQVTFLKENLNI